MNVLFIYSEQDPYTPEKPLEWQERVQFGISYISSFLKERGHNTRLLVLTKKTRHLVAPAIREFDPGLICFTAVYSEYAFLVHIAAEIKRRFPGIFLLAGGPHVSLSPEECINDAFDALCIGEGEYPSWELVEQLERGAKTSGIQNLWIKMDGEIERNPTRPFIQDLDSLPFPDRVMWEPWIAHPSWRPSVLLGRGCPFQCTYCCNHALRKLAPGRYVRLRSPVNIVQEIEEIRERYPDVGEIYLEVETFGARKEWALELCNHLEQLNGRLKNPIVFGANLRVTPGCDHEELFAACKRSNFRFINIGLESGSERVRREVLRRHYSNDDIINTVRLAKKYGLQVGIYNLIGIPGESNRDFKETIRVNRICQPDWFLLSVVFPYPGTDLFRTSQEQGLLEQLPDTDLERRRPALKLPDFSPRQIRRHYTWFSLEVYRGYKPLGAILMVIIRSWIFSRRRVLEAYRGINRFFQKFKSRR
jgi:radical SAM superfamily enzyme YgiQ (UPF0313 family)